jgi:vancomycin resistance protein YoaR
MQPEIQNRLLKLTPRRIVIISLVSLILIMLAITGQVTYSILQNDKIYDGVYINKINASGLSTSELSDLLKKDLQKRTKGIDLTLKCVNFTEKIYLKELNVSYNLGEAVKKAYSIGRTGNVLSRLTDIVSTRSNGVAIDLPITYDKKKVNSTIQDLYDKTFIRVKEADLFIQNNKITIRSGHHGENIDKSEALSAVDKAINDYKGGILEIPIVETPPSQIDIEDFYNRINQSGKDVTVTVVKNKVQIVQPVIGRQIDKTALVDIAGQLEKSENTEKVLPVKFTQPKNTVKDVTERLFKDTLATMSTRFSTGTVNNRNRGTNIALAVSKINGTVIGPGQVFSFNGVVGPRTEAGGYKTAHTYVANQIVDGIGGGICQVSTTLYNAVLFSDMEVLERSNHTFTVGYVPFGRDAAVSYGGLDLKFRNNTNWPIKLSGRVTSDNRIIFSLIGTNETPGKVIEINPRIIKTINAPIQYINDSSLKVGRTIVKSSGMKGYVVDTYKVVKINGKVISEKKIHRSTYIPHPVEILRGTKK